MLILNMVENNNLTKYFRNESKFTFRMLHNPDRPFGTGIVYFEYK